MLMAKHLHAGDKVGLLVFGGDCDWSQCITDAIKQVRESLGRILETVKTKKNGTAFYDAVEMFC